MTVFGQGLHQVTSASVMTAIEPFKGGDIAGPGISLGEPAPGIVTVTGTGVSGCRGKGGLYSTSSIRMMDLGCPVASVHTFPWRLSCSWFIEKHARYWAYPLIDWVERVVQFILSVVIIFHVRIDIFRKCLGRWKPHCQLRARVFRLRDCTYLLGLQ